MSLNIPTQSLRRCATTAWACLLLMMAGGTAHAQPAPPSAAPAAPPPAVSAAAPDTRAALACPSHSNCVNSLDTSDLGPLPFAGSPADAMAALRATLKAFPEAQVVKADALSMEVIFTTFLGFRDAVDFRIDAQAQRIDYRSRSLVGRYDFGKNHSRMAAFSEKFKERAGR